MIESDPSTWRESLVDPFREELLRDPSRIPERLAASLPPLRGEPAFDPEEIRRRAERLPISSSSLFTHPLLERSVRVGLAHIDATFQGDHPRYGAGAYADPIHDGFPPTIIAAVDALTLWGMTERAAALFTKWLDRFVTPDGGIDYYGPSLSEFGQLLTTARRLAERGADAGTVQGFRGAVSRLSGRLRSALHGSDGAGMLSGVPEADEKDRPATYFHNNAWIVRGLSDWAWLLREVFREPEEAERVREDASTLERNLLDAIESTWPDDPGEWWLPPALEEGEVGDKPEGGVTGSVPGSYTNYRYWPELLSSGVLARRWAERVVWARLRGGGQFAGTTRFLDRLDDWPLADYLAGLSILGRSDDLRLSLWGHLLFHQADRHLTAYEQVTFPPGSARADYCLPCQLVAARAVPLLAAFTE